MTATETLPRVLLIEDDSLDRETIRRHIGGSVALEEVDGGAAARAAFEGVPPDCVLLDYRLPDCDGFELLREMLERWPEVPVVVLTGQGSEEVAVEALKSGAEDYLVKGGATGPALMKAIGNAIEKRRLRREARVRQEELDQVVRVIAHDLRSPLTALTVLSEIVREDAGSSLTRAQSSQIGKMQNSIRTLTRLVEGLQVYSRAGAPAAPRELVDLEPVVWEAWDAVAFRASGARLVAEVLPEVNGVRPSLHQLFQNLFENAVRYRSRKPLVVSVTVAEEGGHWRIRVQDNGRGLDPSKREAVLRPFVRGEDARDDGAEDDDAAGRGLGLTICERIVRQHAGRLWIDPDPGAGFTVLFTLARTPS